MPDLKSVYADNSATSFPKNKLAIEAMQNYLTSVEGNPQRTFSYESSEMIFEARENIASFVGKNVDSSEIIFTSGATMSANMAIFGILKEGDHVVVSSMEHNAVIRPLLYLKKTKNIVLDIIEFKNGHLDVEKFKKAITPKTKMAICLHGSNVTGEVFDIKKIAEAKQNSIFLCDTAQTAGHLNIDPDELGVDILFFSGHKGTEAPFGVGVLYKRKGIDIEPLIYGGTGFLSESEDMPESYPEKLEAGTCNAPAIIALSNSVEELKKNGLEQEKLQKLTDIFIEEISNLKEIKIFSGNNNKIYLPTISITSNKISCSDMTFLLKQKYNITTRAGLHCSPMAHKSINTFPNGTTRISFGRANTEDDVKYVAK
ncbi:aminotransferase class V-fold PLP-dependent enzyme, partial [bacterium]|nr:aminotransferase class V-fold PLP-dependent enzyme [bacterium]